MATQDFPRVLCLGEVLWDEIADQPVASVESVTSWTPHAGGAPANVASALVKLGTTAGFVGCVGEDEAGMALVEVLETAGVDTTGVQYSPTAPTRKIRVLRPQAENIQFVGFHGADAADFADAYLQAEQLPVELFRAADYLVLGTLELAYADSRRAIARALELAEQYYLKVILDVNWRPVFWPNPDLAQARIQPLIARVEFSQTLPCRSYLVIWDGGARGDRPSA
ncbi:PfkB family carbohydrate kinase [Neosynechococcus sphagnicola]|uniref:PfkB family carbohydrate kinase n=1 Tax=Neosynechococcus sphagnicola TaxID=1501145 RepID=UPI0023BA9A95|nr:PfkB family carbohydrate kinase [Neosynechococcus sphagnicola]